MTVVISKSVLRAIQRHARETYPEECCGFLFGKVNAEPNVEESRRARNIAPDNRSRRYTIDPLELLHADGEARKKSLDLIGIYHSHPDHPAAPSEYDRSGAAGWLTYVIVRVVDGNPIEMTAWQLDESTESFRSDEIVSR